MSDGLVCWRCGAALDGLPLPLSRLAECEACHADLHVCKLCAYYDPRLGKQCREPVAEEVQDKERANFCGYFSAKAGAFRAADHTAQAAARAQLDALFGRDSAAIKPGAAAPARSAADAARDQLEQLFGGQKKE